MEQFMAKEIGIRELKIHASEVVRAVKETRARYVITQRGKPAALIIPLDAETPSETGDDVWERLEKLGQEIAKDWKNEKSAVEILSEMRR
jgi:prevent-host-death family protein